MFKIHPLGCSLPFPKPAFAFFRPIALLCGSINAIANPEDFREEPETDKFRLQKRNLNKLLDDMYYSLKLIILLSTLLLAASYSNELMAQYSGSEGEILHSDDVLQLHSSLDELIARATTSISDKPTWLDYPKPYTQELVRKHRIQTIEFQSAIIINKKNAASQSINTDSLPSSIKFNYTYNENGDLVSYNEVTIYAKSKQPGRHCNLRKSYDNAGRLIAWQWNAPPYDSLGDIYVHLENLATLMQHQYGPYNERGWIKRDKNGRVMETVYANDWPKFKKNIKYRKESRFQGNITKYHLKTTEYNQAGQITIETRFKSVLDSAFLSRANIPAAFVVYRYSKNRQTLEKIHSLNSGPLEDSSYWPMGVYKFNLKRSVALGQIDTYRARFAEKDSIHVLALMQSGQMFLNEPGSQRLISAIPSRLQHIAQENIEYDKKSRISQYTLIQEDYPTSIITREYQGQWFVEKGYRHDDQFWLIRRFKKKLMTDEFYTTGFDNEVPSNISDFFKYGRKKGTPPYTFPYELSRTSYSYKNRCLKSAFTEFCDSSAPRFPRNARKKQIKELTTCFEHFASTLNKNDYESLFSTGKDENKALFSPGKRQILFNFTIKTF